MWISSWHPVIDIVYQGFVGHFGVVASIHTLGFKMKCAKTSCEGLGNNPWIFQKVVFDHRLELSSSHAEWGL